MLEQHPSNWIEPCELTESRSSSEKYCEFCGEDLPYHNNSCRLLKVAYQKRTAQCQFCLEIHKVGDDMYDHVSENHKDELDAMGAKLDPSRKKQRL